MLQNLRLTIATVLAAGLLSLSPLVQADWTSDWQQKLGDLWQQTKSKTSEISADLQQRFNPPEPVEVGIAYGTEKKKWLQWAVTEFEKTEAGKKVKINLIPMGSVAGAEAVLAKNEKIHVWSPASSVVEALLTEVWEREHGKSPILSDAPLAFTPMVIVMWKDRYEAFMAKYNEINFKTIGEALAEPTGWAAIADKPQWGLFSFGHTKPTHSNSGLLTLVLMGYDYANVMRDLKPKHIMDEGFLTWMKGVVGNMSADETSTGTLMRTMLQRGPSEFSGVMVYENLALSNLDVAKGRWGEMKMVYPTRSVWNDNPYYILDVPWSNTDIHQAAQLFQDFLLSDAAQKKARDDYLFRPASLDVPILEKGSSFSEMEGIVEIDVPAIRRPSEEVLRQLIQIWERAS